MSSIVNGGDQEKEEEKEKEKEKEEEKEKEKEQEEEKEKEKEKEQEEEKEKENKKEEIFSLSAYADGDIFARRAECENYPFHGQARGARPHRHIAYGDFSTSSK